jgi:hypothetical protein
MSVSQHGKGVRQCGALLLLAAAATLGVGAIARGGVIVNDTWLDGTRTDPTAPTYSENGVDSDGDLNLESAWFQGGDGTLDPTGPGGPLHGAFSSGTIATSASWTTYFSPEAGQVTLNQGDKLRVTWKFKPNNVNASNTSQNFRVALVDSPSAARLTAPGAPGTAAYTGYGMFMNMAPTLGNSSPFRLMERNVASGDLLATSGNWTGLGTTGAASGNHGYDSGTEYTFVMDVTRTVADALDFNVTMSGGTLNNTGTAQVLFTDTTPNGNSFTFDTFGIRPSGATTTAESFDTTLFKVETVLAPEPASLGMLALLTAGAAARRRRSR